MSIYNAIDVANYMVNKSIEMDAPISNLKLQKLLYYVQASKLVQTNQVMFADEISAWRYGPVVESVYHKFKIYASLDITERVTIRGVNILDDISSNTNYNPCSYIDTEDCKIIDEILTAYASWHAMDLVRKTHDESPWSKAYYNNIKFIDTEEIRKFYSEHTDKLFH